jgi:hypothetical protein
VADAESRKFIQVFYAGIRRLALQVMTFHEPGEIFRLLIALHLAIGEDAHVCGNFFMARDCSDFANRIP